MSSRNSKAGPRSPHPHPHLGRPAISGAPGDPFASRATFPQTELAGYEALPDRRYTKEELRSYLATLRADCKSTLTGLTEDEAWRTLSYPWTRGAPATFVELQIYNTRHIQDHAAQLCLFLSANGVSEDALGWVGRARE